MRTAGPQRPCFPEAKRGEGTGTPSYVEGGTQGDTLVATKDGATAPVLMALDGPEIPPITARPLRVGGGIP